MLEQELSEMDRVTQLQDAIEELFGSMSSSIKYLSTASSSIQVNPDIPITKTDPSSIPPDEFETKKKALVDGLMEKANLISFLIDALPVVEKEEAQVERLATLEPQMKEANNEYRQAVDRAKLLYARISDCLRKMLDAPGT